MIEGAGEHRHLFAILRPVGARAVAVDLEAVAVGVGEIDGLADAMVGQALNGLAALDQAREDGGECRPVGHEQGDVEEAGHAFCGLDGRGVLGEGDDGRRLRGKMKGERAGVRLTGDEPERVAVKRQQPRQVARDEGDVAEDEGGSGRHPTKIAQIGAVATYAKQRDFSHEDLFFIMSMEKSKEAYEIAPRRVAYSFSVEMNCIDLSVSINYSAIRRMNHSVLSLIKQANTDNGTEGLYSGFLFIPMAIHAAWKYIRYESGESLLPLSLP